MWFSCAGLVIVIFIHFFLILNFLRATSKSFESRDIKYYIIRLHYDYVLDCYE